MIGGIVVRKCAHMGACTGRLDVVFGLMSLRLGSGSGVDMYGSISFDAIGGVV